MSLNKNPYKHIIYKRGYLISDTPITPPHKNWKLKKINNKIYIYYDSLNKTTYVSTNEYWIFILGTIINIKEPSLSSKDIGDRLLKYLIKSERLFFDYLDILAGRHFILFGDSHNTRILSDATGMRSIFYSSDRTVIASHCELINQYVNATTSTFVDRNWLTKYNNYYLPGHFTPYENIFFLTPNTYLCIEDKKVTRFFPRKILSGTTLEDSVHKISQYADNQLKELVKRYDKLLLSLSAGSDSRISLALTKKYQNNCMYFTYSKENFARTTKSIEVLKIDKYQVMDIVNNLGLNHEFISIDEDRSYELQISEFIAAIQKNTYTKHNFKLAKQYYENFNGDYLHLRSNITEIGKYPYAGTRKLFSKFTPDAMVHAYSTKATQDKHVREAFEKFYNIIDFEKIYNYDPFTVFYWEYRMGTWHSQLLLESDVAHDTYILFNAREILKYFISVPIHDIKDKKIFHSLISHNWPVLNYWKVNEIGNIGDNYIPQIDNYGMRLTNLEIESGSMINTTRKVMVRSEVKKTKAKYFIDIRNPKKGDYVNAKLNLNTKKGQRYFCIVQLRSPYINQKNRGRIKYQVFINDKLCLEEDISDWRDSNHIHIKWLSKNGNDSLTIRTVAIRDCEDWGWGRASIMYIERILCRKENHTSMLYVESTSPYSKISIENQ